MAPEFLANALKDLPQTDHPDLLVGFSTADDAGVFKINDTQALVQTVDFFPPIVDDPYHFGRIAAANALSDVYAMGGKPLTALNIVAFPSSTLQPSLLTDILKGGKEKIEEAGAVVVGGHSIDDKEMKYGVAVTGIVNPREIITNAGAQPGDRLFLTKPLGTGLITTGIKRGKVSTELETLVTNEMAKLNRSAAEAMASTEVHAATDITGFGLIGHVLEVAHASSVSIQLDSSQLPLLPDVLKLAEAGMIPGGANANRSFLSNRVSIASNVTESLQRVLFDPQTSGGLLIVVPENVAGSFSEELAGRDLYSQSIGKVIALGSTPIIVT